MKRTTKFAIWLAASAVGAAAIVLTLIHLGVFSPTGEAALAGKTPGDIKACRDEIITAWARRAAEVHAREALQEWESSVASIQDFGGVLTDAHYAIAYRRLADKAVGERDYALALQLLDRYRLYVPESDAEALWRIYVSGRAGDVEYLTDILATDERCARREWSLWTRMNREWARGNSEGVRELAEADVWFDDTSPRPNDVVGWLWLIHIEALTTLEEYDALHRYYSDLSGLSSMIDTIDTLPQPVTAHLSAHAAWHRGILEAAEATDQDILGHKYGIRRMVKALTMLGDVSFEEDRGFFRQKAEELRRAVEERGAALASTAATPEEELQALRELFDLFDGNLLTPDDRTVRWKSTPEFRMFEFAHHTVVVHPRGWNPEAFEVTIFAGHVKSYDDLANDIDYDFDREEEQLYSCDSIEFNIDEPQLLNVSFHGFQLGQPREDAVAMEIERIRKRWPDNPGQRDLRIDTMDTKYNVSDGSWPNEDFSLHYYFFLHYEEGRVSHMSVFTEGVSPLGSQSIYGREYPVLDEGEFEIPPTIDTNQGGEVRNGGQ